VILYKRDTRSAIGWVGFVWLLPSSNLWHLMSLNLRTHRKLLVTDGCLGFTGGINIRAGTCLKLVKKTARKGPRRQVGECTFARPNGASALDLN
jgi:phosphatidylserine/phosphatidylglycerophosphate/cardiolipin synthase-like enzyme